MGMPVLDHQWTREEVLALPEDGRRYELVDGELLVSPSPRPIHQIAVVALVYRLAQYVRENACGLVLTSPADLDLRSGQLMQPDIFVVAPEEGRGMRTWTDVSIPLLVVEVLSASTARYDRVTKRQRFQRSAVPTYWIVDCDARVVEVWTPKADRPMIASEVLVWRPDAGVEALSIDLAAFFAEIGGER